MFGLPSKEKFAALQKENLQLKQQVSSLESEIAEANNESHQLAEDMASNTERYRHQEEINTLWLSSSNLINNIREDISSSSSELTAHRDKFQTSEELFSKILSMLASTIVATSKISHDSQSASTSVDNLKSTTAGINDFVNIIKGISDQTNLLALNAAIEAARAGEQGRGFAVVADEVRTLAQRSAEASNEISNLIEQVNQQMEHVIEGIHGVGEKSIEISQSTSNIESTADNIVTMSKSMYSVINSSTVDAFLQAVKLDHLVWKQEVYQAMLGISTKNIDDFEDQHHCQLGQWYFQGEGAEKYTDHSAFKQLETPHTKVHQHGISALKAMKDGNMTQVIQDLTIMENASVEVINLLTTLSNQIKK
ncbi:MAG: methyl-accepting chemotaxis protein [Litorilituus sp.]|jgi:predicted  nucleic acid-binding Zn-ribbon protein|nr:methyl-accepting chemotaxis protein [Litorilituus sp.]